MIGLSLSYKELVSTQNPDLKPELLLPKLWQHGVRSIELRAMSSSACPDEVLRIANLLWDYGFQITLHSASPSLHLVMISHNTVHLGEP